MLRLIGVGDNVVDRYPHCGQMFPGGNAVNFAVYGARLGHFTAYAGLLADDVYSALVERALTEEGVDLSHVVRIHGETGIGSILLQDGDRTICEDNDGGTSKRHPLVIDNALLQYIQTFDLVHTNVNGYTEGELWKIKAAGVPLIYDYSDFWQSEEDLTAVAKDVDFAFFSGKGLSSSRCRSLLETVAACGCELAICTIGKKGAIVFDGAQFYEKIPYNLSGQVVDTLGAGDSFLTGFMVTYMEGRKTFLQQTGGQKSLYCTKDDERDYFQSLIGHAMSAGNLAAIKSCMVLGAFGRGAPYI